MKRVVTLLLLLFVVGCTSIIDVPTMTERLCVESGGHWNECSSPCLGDDVEACIAVCVAQCECSGLAGYRCPEGYDCKLSGKIADELGRCINE